MRVVAASLLIGAAAVVALPDRGPSAQHVLGPAGKHTSKSGPEQVVLDPATKHANWLKDSLDSLTAEARAVWDEVSKMFPEDMSKATTFTAPKKHTKRPNSYWDHVTSGADIQSVWVENVHGEKERDVEGRLESYNLRSKKVDPGVLGVDPDVKQYSGYLDDDVEDKHLFYCELRC